MLRASFGPEVVRTDPSDWKLEASPELSVALPPQGPRAERRARRARAAGKVVSHLLAPSRPQGPESGWEVPLTLMSLSLALALALGVLRPLCLASSPGFCCLTTRLGRLS